MLIIIILIPFKNNAQSISNLLKIAQTHIDNSEYTEAYFVYVQAIQQQQIDETDSTAVRQGYENYQQYIQVLQTITNSIYEPEAKKIFYQLEFDTYEKTIDLAYQLYQWHKEQKYIEHAFDLMELNRNVWLLNTLRGEQQNLTPELIEQEGEYQSQISKYENRIELEKNANIFDSVKIIALEKQRDKWQILYRDFLRKNQLQPTQTKSISYAKFQQTALEPNDVFIEYFNGNKASYCLTIQKDKVNFIKIGASSTLKKLVKDYKNTIHRQEKDFIQYSHQLYQLLIEPLQLQSNQRLIIVPDGVLSFVPFEALLTELPTDWNYDFSKLKYLIYQHTFAYQHSATIFTQKQQDTLSPSPHLLFLAPEFDTILKQNFKSISDDSTYFELNTLTQSSQLQQTLQEQFEGQYFKNHRATYQAFLEHHANHQIIHFATHTNVNDFMPLESKIILAKKVEQDSIQHEGYLHLKELYHFSMQSDLVVLGSCKTGGNFVKRGEGLVGMAYGFRLAGVPSMVYSLWEVDEGATNDVLIDFYKNLKQGHPKDYALHQAKINFLKNASEVTADPYYWASFVMNGNTRAFHFKSEKQNYWWVAVVILVFFGLTGLGYTWFNKIQE